MSDSPVKLIRTDGTVEELEDKHPTLEEMQEAVGGYIQCIPARDGNILVIDEEGKLKGKAPNEAASEKVYLYPGDFIVGDAILMPDDYLD